MSAYYEVINSFIVQITEYIGKPKINLIERNDRRSF